MPRPSSGPSRRTGRESRRRRISSTASEDGKGIKTRAADAAAAATTAGDEMTPDKVAEMWAEFSADHYEIVEQLPLELHRNSRLLRELDQESLSQQGKLQARIRDYVAHRLALATKVREPRDSGMEEEEVKPDVVVEEESGETVVEKPPIDGSTPALAIDDAVPPDDGDAPSQVNETEFAVDPADIEPVPTMDEVPAAVSTSSEQVQSTDLNEPDTAGANETQDPHGLAEPDTDLATNDVTANPPGAEADDDDADAEGSEDAMGSPDADALGSPDLEAAGGADTTIETQQDEPPIPRAVSMSRQSSSSEVGAVDDAIAIDEDVPRPEEAKSWARPGTREPARASTHPRDRTGSVVPLTPAKTAQLALGDIARLMRDLVRNREEMVAIAVGAYNSIDRHIRALDSALSAQETSVLGLGAEPTPVLEEPAPGRKDKKRKRVSEGVPPVIPPDLEVDPNEPRYCYCNNVSFGEMVGCDNEDCPYEWFHLSCLGLTAAPTGAFLCDACKPGGTGTKVPPGERRPVKRKKR